MNSRLIIRCRRMIFNRRSESITVPLNGSPNRLSYGVFPSSKRSWTFLKSNSIPWNLTSTCYLVLTARILLMCPVPLVGRLNQRCRSSRIDEVLECGDSMIILHILHQIPSVLATVPRIVTSSSPSPVKLWFWIHWVERSCTRQRTGDCLWIHLIGNFVILRYQVTKLFCSKYCFARASSVRRTCYFGSQADVAFSVLSRSVYNYCASSIMTRLLEYVPNLSRENCVRVQATLWPQDYLWNPLTRNGRSANGSFASFLSSFRDSCTSLLGASSSLHSKTESEDELGAALFLEAKCVHLVPTFPVVALQKKNCFQNRQMSLEPQEARNCLSCRKYVSHFWVNRGCWPLTHS